MPIEMPRTRASIAISRATQLLARLTLCQGEGGQIARRIFRKPTRYDACDVNGLGQAVMMAVTVVR